MVNGRAVAVTQALFDSTLKVAGLVTGASPEQRASLESFHPDEMALLKALNVDLSGKGAPLTEKSFRKRLAKRAKQDAPAVQAIMAQQAQGQKQVEAQLGTQGAAATTQATGAAPRPRARPRRAKVQPRPHKERPA